MTDRELRVGRGIMRPGATDEEVRAYVQRLRARKDDDRPYWQPWLTARQTRIIRDALRDHDTPIEQDFSALVELRR